MFVDRIRVFAQAGNGGRGSVSFRREKFVPKGGPDGGDGGRGGDVILRADRHVDNLSNLFYEPIIKAKNGGHGMGKKMHGRSAPPKIVRVPVGSIVWQAEENKESEHRTPNTERPPLNSEESKIDFVVDLTHEDEEFVLSRARAIAPRVNTLKGKKASRAISCSSCARSPTPASSVIQTRANRHCSEKFRRRAPRWQRIHLRRCIRLSASWNFPVIAERQSPTSPA